MVLSRLKMIPTCCPAKAAEIIIIPLDLLVGPGMVSDVIYGEAVTLALLETSPKQGHQL